MSFVIRCNRLETLIKQLTILFKWRVAIVKRVAPIVCARFLITFFHLVDNLATLLLNNFLGLLLAQADCKLFALPQGVRVVGCSISGRV